MADCDHSGAPAAHSLRNREWQERSDCIRHRPGHQHSGGQNGTNLRAFLHHEAKGMGLGLSVCRTIIAAHRGKLWATNNADRGATFHFSLPIDDLR